MNLEIVNTPDGLTKLLEFLRIGFAWTHERTQRLRQALERSNTQAHPYGAALLNPADGAIVGGILFFYQGEIESQGQRQHVINLSSLYVTDSVRGVATVMFMKRMIAKLDGYLITSYTSNAPAKKIFLSLGFKYQTVSHSVFGLNKNGFFSLPKPSHAPASAQENSFRISGGFQHTGDLQPISGSLGSSTISGYFRREVLLRKGIGLPVGYIYLNQALPSSGASLNLLLLGLAIRKRVVQLNLYSPNDPANATVWLLRDQLDRQTYIPPLQTEFQVF